MVRVGIENAPKLGVRNSPDKPRRKSNKCNVPLHLKGKEIIVGQGKRLVFRNARRGELIEGGALGNMVTPFSYTFTRPEHCKGKLVLTFSNRDGFETVIYQLTFVNKGGSGAYIANKFDQGKKEIKSGVIVSISTFEGKVGVAIGVSQDLTTEFDAVTLVKIASEILGGKGGGGRKDFAQAGGQDQSKIENAFEKLKALI